MNELFKKITVGITILSMVVTLVPVPAIAVVEPVVPVIEVAPVEAPTVFALMTTYVDLGAEGANVRALQAVLVARELLAADAAEVVAGRYGEVTRTAVIAFKRAYETAIEATLTGLRRQLDAEGRAQLAFTAYVGTATMRQVNAVVAELNLVVVEPPVVNPTVAISALTPAARTVPRAATMVPVLEFDLTAGTEDLNVAEMTFRRTGVGVSADFDGFFLFQEGIRVNEHPRQLVEEVVEFELPALDVTVPAGTTQSFVLATNIRGNATVGNESAFRVDSITAEGVEVEGLPVTGNTQRIGAISVATIDLLRGNPVANQLIGAAGVEIANFRISADAPTLIREILVSIRGTISRGEVTNLGLIHRGERVATAVPVDGRDRLVFIIDEGIEIAEGRTESFSIVADLRGRGDDTLMVYISEQADIIGIDQNLGFGSIVALGGNQRIGDQTLEGGDLVITANNPAVGNIPRGGNDIAIAGVRLLAQRNLEIRDVVINLAGTIRPQDVSDIRIRNAETGATLVRKATGVVMGDNIVVGNLFLEGGEVRSLEVTVDIANVPEVVTRNIRATVITSATGRNNVRDLELGQVIPLENIINPSIVGTLQTVIEAGAIAHLLGVPRNETVITGAQNVPALGFNLAAIGDGITLNTVRTIVRANTRSDFSTTQVPTTVVTPATVVSQVRLMHGTTVLGTSTVRAGGVVDFTGLNLAIAADRSEDLVFQINTASGLAIPHFVAINITEIAVVDANNQSVAVSGQTINTGAARFTTVNVGGTLVVTRHVDTPISAIVPAGTVGARGVNFTTAQLDATREDMRIEEVRVTRAGAGVASLQLVELVSGGNVVATRIFPEGANTVTFSGLNINVPEVGLHSLIARATTFGVGYGATSGDVARLNLEVIKATGVTSGISGLVAVSTGTVTASAATLTTGADTVEGTATITILGADAIGANQTVTAVIGGITRTAAEPGVTTWTNDLFATNLATAIGATPGVTPGVTATATANVVTIHNLTAAPISLGTTTVGPGITATASAGAIPGDVAAIAARGTVTLTEAFAAGDVITVTVGGTARSVTVAAGETITTIATRLATEVHAITSPAVSATSALGVITITADVAGAAGNTITLTAAVTTRVGGAVAIVGNDMTVRRTVPTVTTVAGATALRDGANHLMNITVAANAAGDVNLRGLTVRITESIDTIVLGRANLIDIADNTIVAFVADVDVTAGAATTQSAAFDFDKIIPAGGSRTFRVELPTVTTTLPDQTLVAELLSDTVGIVETITPGINVTGATTLTVANGAIYRVGQRITLAATDITTVTVTITSISGNVITFAPAIGTDTATGTANAITITSANLAWRDGSIPAVDINGHLVTTFPAPAYTLTR